MNSKESALRQVYIGAFKEGWKVGIECDDDFGDGPFDEEIKRKMNEYFKKIVLC